MNVTSKHAQNEDANTTTKVGFEENFRGILNNIQAREQCVLARDFNSRVLKEVNSGVLGRNNERCGYSNSA